MWTVKGIVLALILLRASVQDLSEHQADEFLWVMLLILSLVNFGKVGVTSMVFGALGVFIPQIYDLDFSVRTFNNLIRANCGNVGDLVALSEEDILNLKNMGKKQLAEVALKLKALGLLHTAWEKFLPEEKI